MVRSIGVQKMKITVQEKTAMTRKKTLRYPHGARVLNKVNIIGANYDKTASWLQKGSLPGKQYCE
jgi:hypothetical protein